MECSQRIYYVDRSQLAYLKFIIEGHEGLALITTLDPRVGKIAVFVPPGREQEVDVVLDALQPEIHLRSVQYEKR